MYLNVLQKFRTKWVGLIWLISLVLHGKNWAGRGHIIYSVEIKSWRAKTLKWNEVNNTTKSNIVRLQWKREARASGLKCANKFAKGCLFRFIHSHSVVIIFDCKMRLNIDSENVGINSGVKWLFVVILQTFLFSNLVNIWGLEHDAINWRQLVVVKIDGVYWIASLVEIDICFFLWLWIEIIVFFQSILMHEEENLSKDNELHKNRRGVVCLIKKHC